LGDVRDRTRLEEALHGVTDVVHAAALKRVDAVAYNYPEARRTNIEGSANVASAAISEGVQRVLMLSSDKACAPSNHYGITKAAMEYEAVAANVIGYPRGTHIACTRYGNVLGSRGSVVHLWRQAVAAGKPIPLTDPRMTRFWLTLEAAVGVVLTALDRMEGGEVFVPELPAIALKDLAEALAPGHPIVEIGLRPGGEKLAETLISEEESGRTLRVGERLLAITPHLHPWREKGWEGERVWPPAAYDSDTTPWRLTLEQLREETQ
jgi:UDP-N-acetylglucosamine 4,6-dehydratase